MERPQDPVLIDNMISGRPSNRMVLRSDDVPPNRGPEEAIEEVSINAPPQPQPPPTLPAQQDNHGLSETSPPQENYIQLNESPTVQLQVPRHSTTTDVQTAATLLQHQPAARQNAAPITFQNSVPHPSYSAPRVPVNIQLPQYDGTTSIVQWWMSFMAYVQLYRMDEHQAINIIPFCLSHMIKHWFLNLDFQIKTSLESVKKAFFTRFKNQETADEDIDNISQGTNETVDNYVFRFQQAASDSELPEKYLVQKAIKGLHPILGSAVYMQKPQTFEELRETANHCHRGQRIAKNFPMDVSQTIEASVNAAVTSMSKLLSEQLDTRIAAISSETHATPNSYRPSHRRDVMTDNARPKPQTQDKKPFCFGCGKSCESRSLCWAKDKKCNHCLRKGHIKPVCKEYLARKALGLE